MITKKLHQLTCYNGLYTSNTLILYSLWYFISYGPMYALTLYCYPYLNPMWATYLQILMGYIHWFSTFTRCLLHHLHLYTKLAFILCGLVYYVHLTNTLTHLLWWLIYFRHFDTISAMILYTLWPFSCLYTICTSHALVLYGLYMPCMLLILWNH